MIDFRSLGLFAAALVPLILVAVLSHVIVGVIGWGGWLVAFAAAMVGFLVFTHRYMRRLDEAAWQAQKHAWFWGGQIGVMAGFLLFWLVPPLNTWLAALVMSALDEGARDSAIIDVAFIFGAFYILIAQMAGFFVSWIGWWIAKR